MSHPYIIVETGKTPYMHNNHVPAECSFYQCK